MSLLPRHRFIFWPISHVEGCCQSNSFEPLNDLEVVEPSGNRLLTAAELGNCDAVEEKLAREPGCAEEVNADGLTPLHLACREGHVGIVRKLISSSAKLCFKTDKVGGTPLHTAAMNGRVDVIKVLLQACPESVKEVTATGETCLHTAVVYHKGKVVQFLVKWLAERTDYNYLVNGKDYGGNTVLHIATSRKQLQTLKVLLTYNPSISSVVDVNAMNSGGFTALDILDVLPYCGKTDMEIDKLLRRAGALRARDMIHHDAVYACRRGCHQPSNIDTIKAIIKPRREYACGVLLVIATMLATVTFRAAFSPPGGNFKEGYVYNYHGDGTLQLKRSESIITSSFLLFNSTGFVASVAIIIFLLHEFPMKPWPQISISTLFGSYMCLIMAISPSKALALLLIALPFLLLAALGKIYGFAGQRSSVSSCNGDA
ncbi:hypothetical protein F0562_031444 [Nyssa sinensis]|uniref:PGG domain-containing protein n=1 Tax=Nyssa sinensis TaxID=561372 RepID=A0A5J5AWP6_9ASTE|nr:hypothetical protein F0562_031444 [Nyssa sinensis]